jgi:poly-gamma-glutamate synthesis protein (capsule biosynthesis protein)
MGALLAPPAAPFRAEIRPLDAALRARIENRSWRDGEARCPRLDALAYLTLDHVTFDGGVARGELVVAAALAGRTVDLFRRLYQLGFPIRQMKLVDDYDASDDRSMSADNSSAFNFRLIAGTELLSQHALGRAIDINPVENPWRRPDRLVPAEGQVFADRTVIRPGMFVRPGPVIAMLDEQGWEWGGDWRHAFDDHHIAWSRALY